MTIRSSYRVVVSACALSTVCLLTLAPVPAAARTGPEPAPPGGPPAAAPRPALLHRSGTHVRPHKGAPRTPKVSALAWVVADADSGAVLAAHDAHRKLPPASTLKALFALTVLPVLPGGMEHTVGPDELAEVGPGSSLVGVREGHTYRVSDLWNGVFLNSGNDAVHVLARLNGGMKVTVRRMQDKARALGALDTQVRSPDGYDAPGQVSSAFDLAVFGRAGLRDPDFARYCGTAEARFPGGEGWSYGIRNTNRLLTGADGVRPYKGLLGVKNGYTTHAGNTLIAAAERDGRRLVVTVMNPQQGGGLAVYEEARRLLDWGFAAAGKVDPVGSLDAHRPRERTGAAQAPTAAVTADGTAAPASGAGAQASPRSGPQSGQRGEDGTTAASAEEGTGRAARTALATAALLAALVATWLLRAPLLRGLRSLRR